MNRGLKALVKQCESELRIPLEWRNFNSQFMRKTNGWRDTLLFRVNGVCLLMCSAQDILATLWRSTLSNRDGASPLGVS
jgi:hypothetical protein